MPWLPWNKPREVTYKGSLREDIDQSKFKSAQELNDLATRYKFDMNDYINKPEQKCRIYYVQIQDGNIIES